MRRAWLLFLFFIALASVPHTAWPQGDPLGPEFRVNTYTTNGQSSPSVAADSSGNFVVVWHSPGQDGSNQGVFGQRYVNSGVPLGPEFRVNTYTTSVQWYPSVASDPSGNFVVAWSSRGQDGSDYGVFGQRYASSGAPLGSEFRVNTYTTSSQWFPSVAADSSGNFVVVWTSYTQDGSVEGIFGQRYATTGAPLGPEFRVNTHTTNYQAFPSVAADSSGNFVVVWMSGYQDGSVSGVFGQRDANSGNPLGPEFRANTFTLLFQHSPSVASDPSGNFVVVWESPLQDGVIGQRFASSGAPLGPEFRANTSTGPPSFASVATDSSGNFVVVWQNDDGSSYGVFGQRFASSGAPSGPEFRVNTFTTVVKQGVLPSLRRTPLATSSSSGRASCRMDRALASSASASPRSSPSS